MSKILSTLFLIVAIVGCTDSDPEIKSEVSSKSLASDILKREIQYNLYITYREMKNIQMESHIIYLLHGHGGDHNDWFQEEEGNVAAILDSLVERGNIPPLIAVSINAGNSWYVDSVESMETFYLQEFINKFEELYNLNPKRRIIAGNSAGGYGTLRFALNQPELFESVILLSPAAYEPLPPEVSSSRKVEAFAKDSIWQSYSYTHRIDSFLQKEEKPKFYLSVGDDDNYNIVPVVTSLQQLFLENNISNELRVMDGGHDWTFWKRSFAKFLSDIYAENGATP